MTAVPWSVPAFLLGSARVNDCKAIGGLVGEKELTPRFSGSVRKTQRHHFQERGRASSERASYFRSCWRPSNCACLGCALPGKPTQFPIESLRIFQVRTMSSAFKHRYLGVWDTGQE